MVVHNPNNWHWVDKNCIEWAKRYFEQTLVGLATGDASDPVYATISKINSIEGDCEVNQRKGKVISLFDLRIALSISGHVKSDQNTDACAKGETDWEGSISVPEVAFDSTPADYQFEVSIYKETSRLSCVKPVIREKLLPRLRDTFANFGNELLAAHGNDIQVPEDQVESQFTKANQKSSFQGVACGNAPASAKTPDRGKLPAAAAAAAVPASTASAPTSVRNTTTIHLEPTFNVAAHDLYNTLLDKQRIPAWTRSPVHHQTNSPNPLLAVGDAIQLFGGNVTAILKHAEPPKTLVFDWRLKDWDPAQMSSMHIDFHESREFHETKMVVSWRGIPIGEEDKARANFEEFYVRSIKLTFGFGSVL
ncbi:Aha1p Ecym_4143 [Eremothecium cymbalariae DBVPG|uniref:Activator of Hsp90 ATPase AHSA1-like N-terminal domain-containing protein n=1 Tax=Eremothecium cymbalariae (strain CBS 270.75 / DBVPG 7215 / KCTC 17166 / NRRL Y-17582) TaxID=931890 RepID=G8JT68_ERECY|nr:hypothetical protein Ecym_4143 [Eremothecium cymbalariae DBVPG\